MSTKQRTISAKAFYEKLQLLDACKEALQFVKGKTFRQAYDQCNSPEWMLWLLGRSWIDKKVIQLIAVEFAETCASNAKDYPVVAKCIAVTKRFLKGKVAEQELYSARSAAESVAMGAAMSAESAAWSAARSAAMSAESAAESAAESVAMSAAMSAESAARSAAMSAESAARSAAMSAAWSARSAAMGAAMSNQCNIIRKHVPYDLIANLLFPERTVTA